MKKLAVLLVLAVLAIIIPTPTQALMFQNFEVHDDMVMTSSTDSFLIGAMVADHDTGEFFQVSGTTFLTDDGLYDVFWFLATESEVPEFGVYSGMLYSGNSLTGTIFGGETGLHTSIGDNQFILFGFEQLSEYEPDIVNMIGFTFNTTTTSQQDDDATNAPVPEPATMLLLGAGLLGLAGIRRKMR